MSLLASLETGLLSCWLAEHLIKLQMADKHTFQEKVHSPVSVNQIANNISLQEQCRNPLQSDHDSQSDCKSHGERVFRKLSGGIDFTFNTIKNVRKVQWKDDAPWFREISDGFCWIAYCHNDGLNGREIVQAKERAEGVPVSRPRPQNSD